MTQFAWQIGAPAIGGCVPERELDYHILDGACNLCAGVAEEAVFLPDLAGFGNDRNLYSGEFS